MYHLIISLSKKNISKCNLDLGFNCEGGYNYTSHNAIIFLPYGRAFSTSPSKLDSLYHHVHKVTGICTKI